MHNIPELIIGMLACARIGAVHIVLYNGLSPVAIKNRVVESKAKLIVTSDFTFKRGNRIPLKSNIDSIISECETIEKVIVKKRLEEINCSINPEKDVLWEDLIKKSESDCKAAELNSEQHLFYNYTSGLNGEPVGILHTTGGYMVQTYISTKWIFNLKEDDIFWCTADLSWIAGHSYIAYGPLLNGSTIFFYEGTPNYPNEERYWQLIDKYKITIFYTTPTTIRAFRSWGNDLIKKYNLSSLKLLGTVGEPIQPDTWNWFNKNVGKENCPVINTWLQTETGTILITPFPGEGIPKSESCGLPFPGIEPEILNYKSEKIDKDATGYLVFKNSWPSIMRGVLNNDKQINDFYLKKFKNSFFTGDGAKINKDGTFYILGRVDSTFNVTWQRLSSKEIEDILQTHPDVIETAVVARPDDIKGNSIAAFVVLQKGREELMLLKEELRSYVENKIGTYAKPDEITFLDSLPKDESGKILRRVLRSLAITGRLVEDRSLSEEFTALEKLREDF